MSRYLILHQCLFKLFYALHTVGNFFISFDDFRGMRQERVFRTIISTASHVVSRFAVRSLYRGFVMSIRLQ